MLQLVLLFHIACKWFNHLFWNNRAGSSLYLWGSEFPNKIHWDRLFSLIYSCKGLAVWRLKSINSGQCSHIISFRTQKIILGRKLLSETFTCLLYKKTFCPYCKSFCLLVPISWIFPWLNILMLSHVRLFATPWTVAHQAPLSMEFSRQK